MAAREAQVPSQNGGEMVEIGEVRAVQNGPLASAPDQAPAAPPRSDITQSERPLQRAAVTKVATAQNSTALYASLQAQLNKRNRPSLPFARDREVFLSSLVTLTEISNHETVEVEKAICAIANLAELQGRAGVMFEFEVPKLLQNAMSALFHDDLSECVQRHACRGLLSLAVPGPTSSSILERLDVYMDVQAAMKKHPDSADLQKHACGALAGLAEGSVVARVAMGKEGVYKDVMGAMKKHADIEHVQMHGSRALYYMALDKPTCTAMYDAGVDEMASIAVSNFYDKPDVMKEVARLQQQLLRHARSVELSVTSSVSRKRSAKRSRPHEVPPRASKRSRRA